MVRIPYVSHWQRCVESAVISTNHYNDVIMSTMASQITSLTTVYSIFSSGADQRKHQSSASLAFVRGIDKWPVNSPHKGPVTRKMFPFDDVIMCWSTLRISHLKVYFVKQLSQRFSQTCSGRYVLRFSLVVLQQNNLQALVLKNPS